MSASCSTSLYQEQNTDGVDGNCILTFELEYLYSKIASVGLGLMIILIYSSFSPTHGSIQH